MYYLNEERKKIKYYYYDINLWNNAILRLLLLNIPNFTLYKSVKYKNNFFNSDLIFIEFD